MGMYVKSERFFRRVTGLYGFCRRAFARSLFIKYTKVKRKKIAAKRLATV
jgi:hypothetical protein